MRGVLLLSSVLATGCLYTDVQQGTLEVTWELVDTDGLAGPTCDSYMVTDVVVTATKPGAPEGWTFTAACSAGTLETGGLPLHDFDVSIAVMGTLGDVAGRAEPGSARIVEDDQRVELPTASVPIAPPMTKMRSAWLLKKRGAPATCAELGNPAIQVTMTPAEGTGVVSDIWSCMEINTAIDVPYGPFRVNGAIADAHSMQVLATAQERDIPAVRGLVSVDLSFDVP